MAKLTRIPPFLVLTLLGLVAAFSITRIQFSANIYELFPSDLPEVRGMDWLNRYFSRNGQLIVTITADDAFTAGETATALADFLETKTDLVARVHRELSLEQLATEGSGLLAWLWFNAEPEAVSDMLDRLQAPASAGTIAESMTAIQEGFFDAGTMVKSYDPLHLTDLPGLAGETSPMDADPMASPDGTFRILYVEGANVDFSDYRAASDWLETLRGLVHEWEKNQHPGYGRIGLTGTPAFMAEVGTEMERDMTWSVILTIVLIAVLFWVMHRKHKPLPWIVASMFLVLILTINVAAVVFGDLSVMSVGFAAILMGLAVDYAIVLYREAMESTGTARDLRRTVGPGIAWAAATTAVVFLSLNLSSLPGIAEMGNLVAIGIGIGCAVMLWGFAPLAVQLRDSIPLPGKQLLPLSGVPRRLALMFAIAIPAIAATSMTFREMPHLEANFHPFRIRESPSLKSWQELQSKLAGRKNSIPMVVTADTLEQLQGKLDSARIRLEATTGGGLTERFILPTDMIPNPEHQQSNATLLATVLADRNRIAAELESAGFSDDGARLTLEIFDHWKDYAAGVSQEGSVLPAGLLGEWSIGRLFTRADDGYAALGTVKPTDPSSRSWVDAISTPDSAVASLGSLGVALNERIRHDITHVFLPMMAILVLMLAIVFRNTRDLFLSLFSLFFSAAVVILLTIWTPLSWNSFNVCGLPLLFGTGLDFSIHMIFALRRTKGDASAAQRGIGRALLFCGTSSAIGFGSLAMASAHGLASLGIVCAVGLLVNMAVAVFLLPLWYQWIHRAKVSLENHHFAPGDSSTSHSLESQESSASEKEESLSS